ncbi:hypothetical protein EGR_06838 [Echinococcus granulosus]|uniref:Uncharacterized protein n=1 Tax=Echinococcus granulosus TaxID=6210 RepID=W6UCA7_ECHGR|nr:hypothetical protein EGR_06838 [Echinococcus granulosus]EUB58311.1 hypothetical protein EGR_06838 [Echinococcus granulosus]
MQRFAGEELDDNIYATEDPLRSAITYFGNNQPFTARIREVKFTWFAELLECVLPAKNPVAVNHGVTGDNALNHYLFHLKSSSSSTSSPNLTICHPHTNLLASRRSSDVPKTPVGIQPPCLGSQGGNDETSISTAFLHHEPEQNYIQFCNPPPPPQKHHHHTLPSTCFHEAYQSLSRQGHLQCSQSVFLSPQIDNRRGLIYANGEIGRGKSTLLVPVNSNSHLHSPHYLHSGTEWTWDGPEMGTFETQSAAQAATSTFIVDTAASIQQNNHSTAGEISIAPRQVLTTKIRLN